MTTVNSSAESRSSCSSSRRQAILLFLFLGSYLLAYVVLSSHGSYRNESAGGNGNREMWYPEFCAQTDTTIRTHVDLTPIGWLFLPPMLVDRALIHRTHLIGQ
jgi:hypothetical protein